MAELPHGTVTFLFTDIEGSTRLLSRLRDGFADVLADHNRLLRTAFAAHDGREVHTEGDAFFVAFVRARQAIAAAVEAQRRLASHPWPDDARVWVRMGIHTGEADVRDDDYIGLDVHRAARICAAAHGGQILVSSATHELLAADLADDVALRDLGEHGLKDLGTPQRLFQVLAPGLKHDFPPLRAASRRDGIPPPPNLTIGREDDLRAIADRIGDGARLVTLIGEGGVGKTRLALEVAREVQAGFADGATFVSLAALSRADELPAALIGSLAIVPVPGEAPMDAVLRVLAPKQLLLVLDNLEHLPGASATVSDLLAGCGRTTVLATSREPLALAAEQRHRVMPLPVPPRDQEDEALAEAPSVALFCDRARDHDPEFRLSDANAAAVAETCRRVDGLPLAIELAAARCGLLSPAEIADRLDAALGVLGRGPRDAPARQQTLAATIDWSYRLLDDDEKACFAAFACFAGGASVPAAEEVTACGLDALEALVTKSLLVRSQGTPSRLAMLETVRAYATERLAAVDPTDAARRRHYRHYLALAEREGSQRAMMGTERNEHLAHLDADVENVHRALAWGIGAGRAERPLALCAAVGWYWLMRDRHTDAVAWIDRALAMPDAGNHPALRVRVLCIKALSLWALGREPERAAVLADADAQARALGDPMLLSQTVQARADRELEVGRLDLAAALADEAREHALAAADAWEVAQATTVRALAASTIDELREGVDTAVALLEAVGNVYERFELLASAAHVALRLGDDEEAKRFVARTAAAQGFDTYIWVLLRGNAGVAELLTGDPAAAADAFREQLALCREMEVLPLACQGLVGLAAVAALHGDSDRAARLFGAAAAHRYGQPYDELDARLDAAFFEEARARCGAEAWDAVVEEGRALSLADATAYALELSAAGIGVAPGRA